MNHRKIMRKLAQPFVSLMVFAIVFLIAAGGAQARIIIKERDVHYTVEGKTGREVVGNMIRNGPHVPGKRRVVASTEVDVEVDEVRIAVRDRRCVVESATVRVNLTYTYPRWTGGSRASRKLKEAWQRYYRELVVHEQTHGRIFKESAAKLEREILNSTGRVFLNCADFTRRAKRRFWSLGRQSAQAHRAFDRAESRRSSRISRLEAAFISAK